MTNSKWVTLSFLPVSSHPIPWKQKVSDIAPFLLGSLIWWHLMTLSKWVALPFFSTQSHHINIPWQQTVSDTLICLCQEVSSHCLIPWPTAGEWHYPFSCKPVSSHDQQFVGTHALFFCPTISIHLIPWCTGCEWHTLSFCYVAPFHDQHRLWVTHPFFLLGSIAPWPTGCEWHSPFFLPCMHIHSFHDEQYVSVNTALFSAMLAVSSHLISSCEPTASEWLSFFSAMHLIPLPTGGDYPLSAIHCHSHHISSYNQQYVSDTAIILCHKISSYPHHNQQGVSDTALSFCQS